MGTNQDDVCPLPSYIIKREPTLANNPNAQEIYRRRRLEQEMSFAFRILMICGLLGTILLAMFIYCIIKIVRIIIYYKARVRKHMEKQNAALQQIQGGNQMLNRKMDDEIYAGNEDPTLFAENNDEYYKFQDSINKSLSSFKHYNEKLQNYFMKTRDTDAPDKYDRRVLSKESDDW